MSPVSPVQIQSERPGNSPRTPAGAGATMLLPPGISAHKFFAPAAADGAILRGAIIERIRSERSARVILLQGPAGHGKSTTLQQLKAAHEADGWQTAWLTLDEADNDPRRFALHTQALAGLLNQAPAEVAGLDDRPLTGRHSRRADWLLDRLARMPRPAAIFLDEFQALRDRSILAFFRDLFERVPENTRVFVGSRALPEVGLARLLVNNVALVIGADDLRFSPGEVDQFFALSRELGVSSGEIDTIYRRTDGWPAALQLYRLTLVSPEVRGSLDEVVGSSPRQLAEYLADNVLALQAARTQTFLLRTSLLTRLCAPLCDLVTGRQDSQEMLVQLERTGMFVRSLDAEGHWFKYHGLFSTILADSFTRRSPSQARDVHARAAHWHLSQQQYEEVLHHAVACNDFDLAAETLDVWGSQLVVSGHLTTVERWFDRLPLEYVVGRPQLAIKVAYALLFLRRRSKLRPVLDQLRRLSTTPATEHRTGPAFVLAMAEVFEDDLPRAGAAAELLGIQAGEGTDFWAFECGAAGNVMAFGNLARGNFEAARKQLAAARAFSDRSGAAFSAGYTASIGGILEILQGRLPEALDRFGRELAAPGMHLDRSLASAALASCQVWALYESNALDAAEALFAQYRDDICGSVILDFIAIALVSMARTHVVRGRKQQAMALLDDIERIGHESHWLRLIRVVDWERVRHALLAGDLERARMVAEHIPLAADAVPSEWISLADDLGGEALGRIRLAIHMGDTSLAAAALAVEFSRQPGRILRRLKLHLLEALLRQREGSPNAAQRSLRKALQLGRDGGYVRSFLDEGEGMLMLLRDAYQAIQQQPGRDEAVADEDRAFIERLLQASGTDLSRTVVTGTQQLLEPLSDREQEILRLLAGGASNREIATRLFVSENTVKFHLKNVYAKLAVSTRLQAINVARRLGLVG